MLDYKRLERERQRKLLASGQYDQETLDREKRLLEAAEMAVPREGGSAFLFGRGLGWYATLGSENDYPHNVLLETWWESGAIAAIVLSGIFVFGVMAAARPALQSQEALAILVMIVALIVISLKSGDIVAGVRLVPFVLIASALRPVPTPIREFFRPSGRTSS